MSEEDAIRKRAAAGAATTEALVAMCEELKHLADIARETKALRQETESISAALRAISNGAVERPARPWGGSKTGAPQNKAIRALSCCCFWGVLVAGACVPVIAVLTILGFTREY